MTTKKPSSYLQYLNWHFKKWIHRKLEENQLHENVRESLLQTLDD